MEEHREQALLSKELVTIECDVPLDVELADLTKAEWDRQKLETLFTELEFNTLGRRLLGDEFSAEKEQAHGPLKGVADVEHDYQLADTPDKRQALIEALLEQPAFCFDVETNGLDVRQCDLIGLAFSWAAGTGHYVPLLKGAGRGAGRFGRNFARCLKAERAKRSATTSSTISAFSAGTACGSKALSSTPCWRRPWPNQS